MNVNSIARPPCSVRSRPTCGPTTSVRRTCTPGIRRRAAPRAMRALTLLTSSPARRNHAHRKIARAAEALHLRIREAGLRQRLARAVDVGRRRIAHFDDDAAGEVDAEVESARREQHERARRSAARRSRRSMRRLPMKSMRRCALEKFHLPGLCVRGRCTASRPAAPRGACAVGPRSARSARGCTGSRVNSEVKMPSTSVTAKPLIGPVPNANSTMPAISVVTFESAIAENALSKPA